jgi:hypothetical protein
MALATFLLRGGVLVVALPILVLPSPVGLGNLLGPTIMDVAFQGVTPGIALFVAAFVAAFVGWIVVGGLIAGALEAAATRIVIAEDVLGPRDREAATAIPPDTLTPARILGARVIAHLPSATVFIWASTRLIAAAYRELTSPSDVAVPIAIRVVGGAPEAVIAVVTVVILGEVIGALAARRIVLGEMSVWQALRGSVLAVGRRPIKMLGGFIVPALGLLVVVVPAAGAASASWTAVRAALQGRDEALWGTLMVVVFVGLWMVGLALVAVLSAWRAAVWTVMAQGDEPSPVRSTGGPAARRV